MSLMGMIYKLLIGPLELLFETVFVVANRKVSNPALAIIALSIAMNFLVLPLYKRADALQEEERIREQRMRPWIDHIKKTFKGDERFMMLQTYYRQNNYKPTDSLKGSISLLLEIPFFIAAYRFLSSLELLKGVSFGPITDLGAPDAMISVGDAQINVLPILMTIINLIAASIYMKGLPLKNKVQMFGVAGIFLILLYRSPAGLVFYWTLNNIFSLMKNIFYKLRHSSDDGRNAIHLSGGRYDSATNKEAPDYLFYASSMLLAVLTGVLCPSAVIADSTEEFINIANYTSPQWYIVSAFLLATGTFVIWIGVFYGLTDIKGKRILSLTTTIMAIVGLVNYMLFSRDFGNISANLQYDDTPIISSRIILINLAATLLIALAIFLLWNYKPALIGRVVTITCVTLVIMSSINILAISKTTAEHRTGLQQMSLEDIKLPFSKEGRNVFVIMMDRMAGVYIPYIIAEKPELRDMFNGFTCYSNVISHSTTTHEGAPALYGGYDYAPAKINERDTETIASKHNESLKVMPTLFGNEGYNVTICDPTYAGYKVIPDLSIFSDHPEYNTYNINGLFSLREYDYISDAETNSVVKYRNFFCYSIFRIVPSAFKSIVYGNGRYNSAVSESSIMGQSMEESSKSHGFVEEFLEQYATLCHLRDITDVYTNIKGSFIMMTNDTSHEPMLLQEPEYVPALDVDNTEYDLKNPVRVDEEGNVLEFENDSERKHYHVNMATMLKLGEWFDYLRQVGVYDNTRIIIVSDHGPPYRWSGPNSIYYVDEDTNEEENLDIRRFSCTLLYKDFGASAFNFDDSFATNADVPALALDDIIDNPHNPFTGNPIISASDDMLPLQVARTSTSTIDELGNTFKRSNWFEVDGNVHDVQSWKYIGNK